MKNTLNQEAYKAIQEIFQSGEVSRIVFLKNGKVSVKYHTEPNVVYYKDGNKTLDVISDELEIRKSLEDVKIKPKLKITVTEVKKLNVIDEELKQLLSDMDYARQAMDKAFSAMLEPKKSLFERFYDRVGNFLSNGKSFAPNELKTFT